MFTGVRKVGDENIKNFINHVNFTSLYGWLCIRFLKREAKYNIKELIDLILTSNKSIHGSLVSE